ncbi:MAG: hypothetical protein HFI90_05895 [Clostridia bacterium]|nr:hypothetical protein [Clostridia bacterium]
MGKFVGLLDFFGLLGFVGGIVFLILIIIVAIQKKSITKMFIGFAISIIIFILGISLPSNMNTQKTTAKPIMETSVATGDEQKM